MLLSNILYKVNVVSVQGSTSIAIGGLQLDSRKVQKNDCFIAIKGTHTDGHAFIENAINNGASAVICEALPATLHAPVTYIQVQEAAVALAVVSNNYYNEPSKKLKVIGVTGTNGKTTIVTLLWKLFTALGYKCGLISTIQNKIGDAALTATHTTPNAIELQALLHQMVVENCQYVFMECSSHAIHQHRIDGVEFTGAIFSNISHDHLDYHKTFDDYIRVKKSWFDGLLSSAFAISNADDKRGAIMLQNTKARKVFYGLKTLSDYKGKILDNSLDGLHMTINDKEVFFRLIGEFNAYNLLAVYGTALCLGQDKDVVLQYLSQLSGAEGRFDYTISEKEKIVGIIDYAHTPDALLNVLATIKKLRHGHQQIITVTGCGGDRDRTKRPIMAAVACEHSDKVIFTSDNPRSENPEAILQDMQEGVTVVTKRKCITNADRKEAIKMAVSLAKNQDILLIAGKGHEKYQEIKGVKYPFDDKKVLVEMFDLLEK